MSIPIYLYLAMSAYAIDQDAIVSRRNAEIVNDAISRWRMLHRNPEKAMNARVPLVFYLKNERCVVLKLRGIGVGGEPVYCYEMDRTVLTQKNDDVE